jgi:hypothetical protein
VRPAPCVSDDLLAVLRRHEIGVRRFGAAISPESELLMRNSVLGQSNPMEMDSAGPKLQSRWMPPIENRLDEGLMTS